MPSPIGQICFLPTSGAAAGGAAVTAAIKIQVGNGGGVGVIDIV